MSTLWLYAHLGFLGLAVYGIAHADSLAFSWMRGARPIIANHHLERTHWVVTIGLSGLVLSGLYLYWPMRAYLYGQPYFLVKMTFVLALLLNSFFIEKFMPFASTQPYAALSRHAKIRLMLSGAVSTLSWIGAALMAIIQFGWVF